MTGDELVRWLAEARVDQAVAARSRERWLRQQAGEEATLVGVLLDLAERGSTVVVESAGGRRQRTTITAVAEDFCALRSDQGSDSLVAYAGIASVAPLDDVATSGDRPSALDMTLVEALGVIAAERPRVLVIGRDGSSRAGALTSVGRDAITLRTEGTPRHVYLPVTATAEVAITG